MKIQCVKISLAKGGIISHAPIGYGGSSDLLYLAGVFIGGTRYAEEIGVAAADSDGFEAFARACAQVMARDVAPD